MQPVSKGLMRFADVAFGSLRVGPSTIFVHYNTCCICWTDMQGLRIEEDGDKIPLEQWKQLR